MPSAIIDTPGAGTWLAPIDVLGTVTLIMRGRGADGEPGDGSGGGGTSGGGGAYVRYEISVINGTLYDIYNGASTGDDTWFDNPSNYLVRAGIIGTGGAADSPGSPIYNAAGDGGGNSGSDAGFNGGNAGNEPGGPATTSQGGGGPADGANGGPYGGGGASGGSYYFDNGPVYDLTDPDNPIFLYEDEGYSAGYNGLGGPSAIELQWVTAPEVLIEPELQIVEVEDSVAIQEVVADTAVNPPLQIMDLEYFTALLQADTGVNLQLQTVTVENIPAPWGLDNTLTPDVQEVEVVLLTPASVIDVTVEPSLQAIETEHYTTEAVFSINLTLQVIDGAVLAAAPVIGLDVVLEAGVQEVDLAEFPLEILFDVNLDVGLQTISPYDGNTQSFLAYPTIFTPHLPDDANSHFAEASRSSSSIIIFGSQPGPFKLNPSALSYRRGGRSHVVQLGRAKPKIVQNYALFDLVSPSTELSIKEFDYFAPGGYLEIWNDYVIFSTIVPLSNDNTWAAATAAIVMDALQIQDVFGVVAGTGFDTPRTFN